MRITYLFGLFLFSTLAYGQGDLQYSSELSIGKKLGRTAPLIDYLHADRTDATALANYKANRSRIRANFNKNKSHIPGSEQSLPIGEDPLFQDMASRNLWEPSSPLVVAEGLSELEAFSGVPDPNGDVSDNYYVEVANATVIQVYDKNGDRVGPAFSANAIWEQVGFESAGDPIILFDHLAGRWFLSEFPFANRMLIAVSDGDDPLGNWTAFSFQTPSFPDYPKYGIWPDAYLLTVNEPGTADLIFYTLRRQDILSGLDTFAVQRHEILRLEQPGVQSASPVGWIGDIVPADDAKPMVVRLNDDGWGNVDQDQIEIFEVDTDWENPDSTTINEIILPTTPFDAEFCEDSASIFVCVPQPGQPFISAIPRIIWHRVSYRNFGSHASIVLNFGVDVTGEKDGGVRWMELRQPTGDAWSIHQEGTIGSSDGLNRFLGGISIDGDGNIGIAYAVSDETTFPSLRFTGRAESDPLGEMTLEEYTFAEGLSASRTPRYGDYHSMSVDRNDVFWFTGQYMSSARLWSTKVAAFKVRRDSVDLGVRRITAPVASAELNEESVQAVVRNYGQSGVDSFAIGLSFDGEVIVVDTVKIDEIKTDSLYVHNFSRTVQFGEPDEYTVQVYTSIMGDDNVANDTCTNVISKPGYFDAALLGIDGLRTEQCETDVEAQFLLKNEGVETLTHVSISYSVNGDAPEEIFWMGELATGVTESIPVTFTDLEVGNNEVSAYVRSPNDMPDERPDNDSIAQAILVSNTGEPAQLEILTTLLPENIFWELQDEEENVLYSGGMYDLEATTYVEEWCLDHDDCYRFILYDADSIGMTTLGVNGDFEILNSDGIVVAALGSPFFGYSDTTDFCMDYNCAVSLTAFVGANETQPGANNGILNLFAGGGSPPYEFSIDSGMTFAQSSLFPNLAPGDYHCLIRDAANCEAYNVATILDCTVEVMFEVNDASGMDEPDGSILFDAMGGRGTLRYSIDGGSSFQTSPLFENLVPDTFAVQVRDSLSCRVLDSVIVSFTTSTGTTIQGHLVRVFPNPSGGEYFIEISGLEKLGYVRYQIVDNQGRLVKADEAVTYNGVLKAAVSINDQPDGVYYLRIMHPDSRKLIRLVKVGG